MKLEQSFEVDAPPERVWEALVDIERVAPCLPGAAVTGRNEDGTYNGTFTIKIGPTTASYTGKLEMQNVDESARSATLHAHGSDMRGQGGATATIVSTLSGAGRHTRVEVVTDYHITGRLARFGRGGMIEDISERLLREFAGRLQSSLAGVGASEAATAVHHVEGMPEPAGAVGGPAAGPAGGTPSGEVPPPTDVAAPAAEVGAPEPGGPPEPPASPPPSHGSTEGASPPAPPPPAMPEEGPSPPAPPPPPMPEEEPLPAGERPPVAASATTAPEVSAAPEPPAPPPPGVPAAPAAPLPPPPLPPPPAQEAAPPPTAQQAPPPTAPPPAAPSASEPLGAGSHVGSTLVERVKRNPKPVIAVAGGLLLLRLLRRRR